MSCDNFLYVRNFYYMLVPSVYWKVDVLISLGGC
jgi:hypothetical protein